ncbi:YkvA family protein [Bacillus taeanensis]|uniref:Methyltransferase type 11 n=1 Tax=Bacillus taeanensis TaxID=273032 RepID=A0A366XSG9_9BACI|nr:YkvA family protein [Bacillus taeanensis]RBW69330.1 methyltransferase type 11 [Bacillus taeanensis]
MIEKEKVETHFKKMENKAKTLSENEQKTEELTEKAAQRAEMYKDKRGLDKLAFDIKALTRLVKNWRQGDYKQISKKSIVMIVAGLLYFVSPADAVPDFLVGLGFVDDAAVVGFILQKLKEEIDRYLKWEQQ